MSLEEAMNKRFEHQRYSRNNKPPVYTMSTDKLIIDGNEFELVDDGYWVADKTPILAFNGKRYHGIAIVKSERDWEIVKTCPIEGTIYSVKRLSDGEVFSVGDDIGESEVIKRFNIDDKFTGGMCAMCGNIRRGISNIQKTRKPLFTTEDGVEIFDGEQIVWYVDERCKLNTRKAKNAHLSPKCVKIYSNADAATNHILMNKPMLSLEDVLKTLGGKHNRDGQFFIEMTELAKQKLNMKT